MGARQRALVMGCQNPTEEGRTVMVKGKCTYCGGESYQSWPAGGVERCDKDVCTGLFRTDMRVGGAMGGLRCGYSVMCVSVAVSTIRLPWGDVGVCREHKNFFHTH